MDIELSGWLFFFFVLDTKKKGSLYKIHHVG